MALRKSLGDLKEGEDNAKRLDFNDRLVWSTSARSSTWDHSKLGLTSALARYPFRV
jgi:hypothetical protein